MIPNCHRNNNLSWVYGAWTLSQSIYIGFYRPNALQNCIFFLIYRTIKVCFAVDTSSKLYFKHRQLWLVFTLYAFHRKLMNLNDLNSMVIVGPVTSKKNERTIIIITPVSRPLSIFSIFFYFCMMLFERVTDIPANLIRILCHTHRKR
jgi:hypothetical protein